MTVCLLHTFINFITDTHRFGFDGIFPKLSTTYNVFCITTTTPSIIIIIIIIVK